jgi:hypothetical protein
MYQQEPSRVWTIVLMIAIGVIGIAASTGLITLVYAWLNEPARIVSVDNVRSQWQFAYDMEEDLKASARQVCIARRAVATAPTELERAQRRSQLVAREDNYARIASDYNGRLRDAFRARLVAPPDVRRSALNLEEMILWLRVNEGLFCPD